MPLIYWFSYKNWLKTYCGMRAGAHGPDDITTGIYGPHLKKYENI